VWGEEVEGVLQRVMDKVVGVATEQSREEGEWLWRLARQRGGLGWDAVGKYRVLGSGFFVAEGGWVATARHVVEAIEQVGGEHFFVLTVEGTLLPAEVKYRSEVEDVALLRVAGVKVQTMPLPMASYEDLRLGQRVYVVGNPLGLRMVVTSGIISALHMGIDPFATPEEQVNKPWIQVDAPLNPGNSGGPVINERGEVVGVAVAILRQRLVEGVGFAVPATRVQRVLLLAQGNEKKGCVGLEVKTDRQTPFVRIANVVYGGAADQAGLREGDLLLSVDGYPATMRSLDTIFQEVLAGVPIYIRYVRDQKVRQVKVIPHPCP
jgi:S1-C subfamily serine protease